MVFWHAGTNECSLLIIIIVAVPSFCCKEALEQVWGLGLSGNHVVALSPRKPVCDVGWMDCLSHCGGCEGRSTLWSTWFVVTSSVSFSG